MMLKPTDRLRKYRDLYRLTRREDGIWYLLTRYPDDGHGMTFDVYEFSDTHQAACLPPQTGASLLKRCLSSRYDLHRCKYQRLIFTSLFRGRRSSVDLLFAVQTLNNPRRSGTRTRSSR